MGTPLAKINCVFIVLYHIILDYASKICKKIKKKYTKKPLCNKGFEAHLLYCTVKLGVAVFSGSFDGDIKSVLAHKADVLVAGDIKYHTAVEALEDGLCIIDAGHFETERIIVPKIAEIIKDRFPKLDVIADNEVISPFRCC
jgi:putative NIF3 family GTP cyclohydrolase 1 type 2